MGTFRLKKKFSLLQLFSLGKELLKICVGFLQSTFILLRFRPQIVVGFGSKHTFPVLFSAWILRSLFLLRIPLLLHEGNSVPGCVNQFFSKKVDLCATFFPEANRLLQGHSIQTIFPLRKEFFPSFSPRETQSASCSYSFFDLEKQRFTFLVFGGSQGASVLNTLFPTVCECLAEGGRDYFQVLHLAGNKKMENVLRQQYKERQIMATVKEYEPSMHLAWQVADLAICRSGSGTIAEQIVMAVPAILIPYPYATDRHQEKNAHYLEKKGGAIVWKQKEKHPESLAALIRSLVTEDRQKLQRMRGSLVAFRESYFMKKTLCSLICDLLTLHLR